MDGQLTLFTRKTFPVVPPPQVLAPIPPTGESSVMSTLPLFCYHLHSKQYSVSTIKKYYSDVRQFSVFLSGKHLAEITKHDVKHWIETLVSAKRMGGGLDRKTVNRKISAVINYFSWLAVEKAIAENPTTTIGNARIQSPLPDYLYESEVKMLYATASGDPRMYLLVLILLETGMKSYELLNIKQSDIDLSDVYKPEVWIKHTGKGRRKDRKVALPPQFGVVYQQYTEQYLKGRKDREPGSTLLFPYTDRMIQMLFADLKKQTGITKELTPKTLRHTHVVRALKRGEDKERIFDRIGLAEFSRQEAYEDVYARLASGGI